MLALATGLVALLASCTPVTSPSYQQLANARVPSLCGHPATTLVNGQNLAIPAGQGTFQLLRTLSDGESAIVRGVPSRDGGSLTAIVAECNAGGVGFPSDLVLFGAGPKVYAESFLDSTKWAALGLAGPARDGITSLRLVGRELEINVDALTPDDPECCPSRAVVVHAHPNAKRLIIDRIVDAAGD